MMTTTTIDTNNFADMAQQMGMGADMTQKKQTQQLARLKINHSPIMGEIEVKGKKTQAAIVNGGTFKIEDLANDTVHFADMICIRPFVQRFMYKKFVKPENGRGFYVKTVMADSLNVDLKDNMGGFNCGKPTGWVKDYQALPDKTKALLKSIKRVRVLIGTISASDTVDLNGNSLSDIPLTNVPFIWEIDNRDAFKIMGEPVTKIASMKHIMPNHKMTVKTEERKLPNGSSFYLPVPSLTKDTLDINESDQEKFGTFMQWIENYNVYIFNSWKEKAKDAPMNNQDTTLVEDFVNVSSATDDDIPF